jgi:hypothetical protein
MNKVTPHIIVKEIRDLAGRHRDEYKHTQSKALDRLRYRLTYAILDGNGRHRAGSEA